MNSRLHHELTTLVGVLVFSAFTLSANPTLTPGTWLNITPSNCQVGKIADVFLQGMAIDRRNPSILYLGVCAFDVQYGGLYKTTNAGSNWTKVGNLDEPVHTVVDPNNSNHLYCVDGVRGGTTGFWISNDGGNTWTQPQGYKTASQNPVGTQDLYSIATNPTDFNHILVSFHGPWNNGSNNAGVLESKDGGSTWRVVNPPAGSVGGYGMSIFFLYFPEHSMGNENTWLFTAQQGGFFRTSDAGATWSLCYDKQMTHGGNQIYCSKTGVLYSGGYQYPARSTNNGVSWQQVTNGVDYSWYMGVCGDGNSIYIASSGTNRPFWTSPETDGLTWTAYQGGAQTFSTQPFEMFFDSTNGIMYSASWGGLWALKVLGWTKNKQPLKDLSIKAASFSQNRAVVIVDGKSKNSITLNRSSEFYDIKGNSLEKGAIVKGGISRAVIIKAR